MGIQYKIEELKYEDRLDNRCKACKFNTEKPWESLIVLNELCVKYGGGNAITRRHWTCVTPNFLERLMHKFEHAENSNGFDCLSVSNQERVKKAWESKAVSKNRLEDLAVLKEEKQHEDQLKYVFTCFEDMMNH